MTTGTHLIHLKINPTHPIKDQNHIEGREKDQGLILHLMEIKTKDTRIVDTETILRIIET